MNGGDLLKTSIYDILIHDIQIFHSIFEHIE